MNIANQRVDIKSLAKTEKTIYARLSNEQKSTAEMLYQELNEIYSLESIENKIIPKLLNDEDCEPYAIPLKRQSPVYPKAELRRGRMGVVHAEFTISPEGYAREIIIVASTSRQFTINSKKAIEKYLYQPAANGNPRENRINLIYQITITGKSNIKSAPFVREIEALEKKAEAGDIVSQFMLARNLNTYKRFEEYLPERSFQHREANNWFTKSAKAGLPHAQFEIGRNMMEGRGCEVDQESGFKWIKAAAIGGHSRAQKYLASTELYGRSSAESENRSILSWLKNASQDEVYGYPSKLLLAWMLVASTEKDIWNPDKALELIKDPPYTFHDDLRILETEAAAWALKGNFKKAVKLQEKAIKLSLKKGWNIAKVQERLETYQRNQFYLGSYY
jgi:TPR repeat protein